MSQPHENTQHELQYSRNLDSKELIENENQMINEEKQNVNVTTNREIVIQMPNPQAVMQSQNHQHIEEFKLNDNVQEVKIVEQQQQDKDTQQQTVKIPQPQHHLNFILDRYRELKHQTSSLEKSPPKLKAISKQERLQKIIPSLFVLGCKNRTKMVKGKTFDEIQNQLKFMNLQKFINFCIDFQIQQVISRQILIETFKSVALNRLTLDLDRFSSLIKKLVEKNPSLLSLLLQNEKVLKAQVNKNKFQRILTDRQNSLSKYNYKLRPINGKDIETLEQDLKQKKGIKELLRKEKQSMLLRKKQGIMDDHHKRIISKKNTISQSKLSVLNPNQVSQQWMRKPKQYSYSQKFNPESLMISHIADGEDQYLDEYEARIWKRDHDSTALILNEVNHKAPPIINESILETALSKRIERGNKVIKKITSSYLKYYV